MNFKKKPKILIFLPYYLPSFGGPLKTIVNLTNELEGKYDFFIITSDRDPITNKVYEGIKVNSWNNIGSVYVYYCSPNKKLFKFIKILKDKTFNTVYLNSFFSLSFTILPLLIIKYFIRSSIKIIIAPRGEFNKGALKIKKLKKFIYLCFFKNFLLTNKIVFQASSQVELKTIKKQFLFHKNELNIFEAPDFPSPFKEIKSSRNSEHSNTFLKLVFISRITPIKNLLFLLSILRNCSNKIQFDIYGPISDINYWKKCTDLISKMPPNIKVSYLKEIHADLVSETFSKYHLFALPTLGENFGHVIIESLFAGTPVVLSDKTPWESSNDLSLRIIPLKARNIWTEYIDSFLCNFKNNSTRKDAIIFGKKLISKQKIYEKNVTLFDFVCLK